MNIKTVDSTMIMSEGIVCVNYFDMKHFYTTFEKISDYDFKCTTCGAVISIPKRPIVVHDEKGRLTVQVVVESK